MKIDTDVVIVGAGPVGLFQVFELGLLGMPTHVVEALPCPGGQCATLYPEKPIYDIPAVPVCTGQELVERLLEQVRPFAPQMHLGQVVTELEPTGVSGFRLATSAGTEFTTRAVVIAAGLGSFQARPLRVRGIDRFEGVNLAYRVTDRARYRERDVVVLGGGDSALDWALELHRIARSVTLVHRREGFRAQPASVARMRELCAAGDGRMRLHIGRVVGFEESDGRLAALQLVLGDKAEATVRGDEFLVCFGLTPDLGPIAGWGLEVDRKHVPVDPCSCETSVPGVYAVGDINTYPGKKKLILSGFHEAAMAAYAVQRRLDPGAKQHVLYTTTSTLLQQRLGVGGR